MAILSGDFYRTARDAEEAIRVYRTAKAALVERDPIAARAWLESDAARAEESARDLYRAAEIAATQLDIETGLPVGPKDPEARGYRNRGNAQLRFALECRSAMEFLGQKAAWLNERLDKALGQRGELRRQAQERKRG